MTAPCKTCRRDNADGAHDAFIRYGDLTHPYSPGPEIVVLCGSTRFFDEFRRQNLRLTLEGKIVLSIGCDTKSDGDLFGQDDVEELKARLDELHKHKIDLADRVLVLNVGGYIGDSTRAEIEHAQRAGKPIDYLEPDCCPECEFTPSGFFATPCEAHACASCGHLAHDADDGCGHPDPHTGWCECEGVPPDACEFCLEPKADHTDSEAASCRADIEAAS